ncbi:MAG: hypothetical protein RR547_04890 [Raoultibacter sp.]
MSYGEVIASCPKCSEPLIYTGKVYTCSTNRTRKLSDGTFELSEGCGFRITPIGGKLISQDQAKRLVTTGKTEEQEFISRWSGKPYRAYLILNEEKDPKLFIAKDHTKKRFDPIANLRRS